MAAGDRVMVKQTDGQQLTCRLRGHLRLQGDGSTHPVAVGDRVTVEASARGDSVVTAILPRRNELVRRASNLSRSHQVIAANVDLVAVVATLSQPTTSTTFVDRLLCSARARGINTLLIINKSDLIHMNDDDEEDTTPLAVWQAAYQLAGQPLLLTSTVSGKGIDDLRHLTQGKLTLLTGNSGVGKSSLINCLVPDATRRVGAVSQASHHRGTHTTTLSQLIELPQGGALIDTPGVKAFGMHDLSPQQVAATFPEIVRQAPHCHYTNCTHTHEPHCAVRQALQNGQIAPSRYKSYLSILEELEQYHKYR